MKDNEQKKSDDWYFPPEVIGSLLPLIIGIVLSVFGFLTTSLLNARAGDPTMLWLAVVVGIIGIALLFVARLPLYRQRRFFTFGPGALDTRHRKFYRWAYLFIGASVVLLALTCLTLI